MLRRFMILLFALTLVVAACGDDDSAGAGATVTTMAETHGDDEHADDEAHAEADEHADDEHSDDDHSGEEIGLSEDFFPEATGEVEATYTVEMHDFGFDVEGFELRPGMTVEFVIVNESQLVHEFRLTTEHRAGEHLASGHADHGSEGEEGHHGDRDIVVNVHPGETRTVVMTLPEEGDGFDLVACLIPGHYEAGMFLEI